MNVIILLILLLIPSISNATSWKIDDLYTFTLSVNGTSGAVDADSVPSYRIYEDETGTAILTGSMAKLDDAGTTGFYSEQVTLSAANGLEKGKSYNIIMCAVISAVTHCTTEVFQIESEVDSNTVSGTVTVGSINTDAITATAIAAGAITSSEAPNLDAAVSTRLATAGYTAPDNATITTIQADTNDIQTRIPAALVSGRIDSSIGAIAANAITATSIATGALGAAEMGEYQFTVVSSADCTNSTTIFDTNLTQTQTDHWKDTFITFASGTLAGQTKAVMAFNGTTKCITVKSPGFSTTPTAGDQGIVVNK